MVNNFDSACVFVDHSPRRPIQTMLSSGRFVLLWLAGDVKQPLPSFVDVSASQVATVSFQGKAVFLRLCLSDYPFLS